jgi:hypothetical protein
MAAFRLGHIYQWDSSRQGASRDLAMADQESQIKYNVMAMEFEDWKDSFYPAVDGPEHDHHGWHITLSFG